jgi:integrase
MGGNSTGRKRRFGNVRKLPSGNWQVRYPGPDGVLRTDDRTCETKTEAESRLVEIEADVRRGEWLDPDAGKVSLKEYAEKWIAERDLEDRTRELYAGYLRNHIGPMLGSAILSDLSAPRVRAWRNTLKAEGVGATTIARSYSLLRAVLNTAVDDEILRRNPCRIRGAGQAETPERPTASLAEVFAIAASIQRRYRLLVLFAAFGQLRFGELVALRKSNLTVPAQRRPTAEEIEAGAPPDELLDDGTPMLHIVRALAELDSGARRLKGPKSTAGRRTVALPAAILPEIREHLKRYAETGPDGRLFIGPKQATPRRSSFNRTWKRALTASQANPALHLHDLRHTGGTLTAQTGATLKEIMSRIGHGTTRAAMVYQHATSERDRRIAEALNVMIEEARSAGEEAASRTRLQD